MSIVKILPDGTAVDFFSGNQAILPGDVLSVEKGRQRNKEEEKIFELDSFEIDMKKELEDWRKEFGQSFF
ncbi:MAG: hypothetical protein PHY72_00045 [Candidatus Pacebacteria bacterium]|nr:hypothetical protein [Candidatus Paceibacterota bacterium]